MTNKFVTNMLKKIKVVKKNDAELVWRVAGHKYVKKFTLEDGEETSDDYACKSGVSLRAADDKSHCIRYSLKNNCETENSCTLTYNLDGIDKTEPLECRPDANGEMTQCPPIEGASSWDKYVEEFTKKNNEMEAEDYEGVTSI